MNGADVLKHEWGFQIKLDWNKGTCLLVRIIAN